MVRGGGRQAGARGLAGGEAGWFGTHRLRYGSAYHYGWSTLLEPGWARRLLGVSCRSKGEPARLPAAYGGGKNGPDDR